MSSISPKFMTRWAVLALASLTLSACATAYSDRDMDGESPLKGLAAMGGMATSVPEAKDFVKDSRPETLNYIPVGVQPDQVGDKKKPLTAEELLLLQQKLDAARQHNNATPAAD